MKKVVNVFWTGGLDSTCRVAELSRMDIILQPYYIIDRGRGSVKEEMRAMDTITKIIRSNENTVCELRDVITVKREDVAKYEDITEARERLSEKYKIGEQYDWLARFARQNNLIIEYSLENSPISKVMQAINGESKLIADDEDERLRRLMIDVAQSSPEAVLLFQNIRFPSTLWNMTKLEEADELKSMGLEEAYRKTWFCHRPVFGLACGHCNPCRDALNEGMAYRVTRLGYVLGIPRHVAYVTYKFFEPLWKRKKK